MENKELTIPVLLTILTSLSAVVTLILGHLSVADVISSGYAAIQLFATIILAIITGFVHDQ